MFFNFRYLHCMFLAMYVNIGMLQVLRYVYITMIQLQTFIFQNNINFTKCNISLNILELPITNGCLNR